MRPFLLAASASTCIILGCASEGPPPANFTEQPGVDLAEVTPPSPAPSAPDEAGGLGGNPAPGSDEPLAEAGAPGAAAVVRTYYALLADRRYAEAWRLWSDQGRASGMSAGDFAAGFDRFADYHAEVGAPGRIEGAAGSLYVEVPVVVHGRLKSGAPFRMAGPMTLRRANDVPGSTAEQRRWRIAASGVRPRPAG